MRGNRLVDLESDSVIGSDSAKGLARGFVI